ncbi:MAG TPA: hypothetical protein GX529_08540 [Firmicutes bacterium]|nr:hypothetical protein [Candidatus Fermentithermobacillaceae bacterium]
MAEVFWSDVGDSLGLSKSLMRDINSKFGSILGITPSNKVPRGSLSAISMIVTMQEQGFSDDEIKKALRDSKGESGWPDIVLSRINEQVASSATLDVSSEIVYLSEDSPEDPGYSWMGCLDNIVREPKRVSYVQDMILDLRREICTNTISEKEQIQRLTQVVERLIAEVRDLRYALVMASSRKDRKKGLKGLSRLLNH